MRCRRSSIKTRRSCRCCPACDEARIAVKFMPAAAIDVRSAARQRQHRPHRRAPRAGRLALASDARPNAAPFWPNTVLDLRHRHVEHREPRRGRVLGSRIGTSGGDVHACAWRAITPHHRRRSAGNGLHRRVKRGLQADFRRCRPDSGRDGNTRCDSTFRAPPRLITDQPTCHSGEREVTCACYRRIDAACRGTRCVTRSAGAACAHHRAVRAGRYRRHAWPRRRRTPSEALTTILC